MIRPLPSASLAASENAILLKRTNVLTLFRTFFFGIATIRISNITIYPLLFHIAQSDLAPKGVYTSPSSFEVSQRWRSTEQREK